MITVTMAGRDHGHDVGSALTQNHGFAAHRRWIVARMVLFLVLSSLPLLAISAHVFGLLSENTSAKLIVVPFAAIAVAVLTLAPHSTDSIVGRGLIGGMVACMVYDGFRLFAVHVLGWMGDFIPTMGTWVTGDSNPVAGAVVGYLWRYIGDAGGLGVAFFILARALGLDRWTHRPGRVVFAGVVYSVGTAWVGLIATVALAPRGQELMFKLTPAALVVTFVGHVVFGLVLGVTFLRARKVWSEWP